MEQLFDALNGSAGAGDFSIESTMLALLLAFVLGQIIAWTYAWTHSGLSYSRSFTQSLVLMTLVVSLVMFVIGNSIITAFGLIGALALIRFRNVLKDTRDTVFVFISLVVGMAVGSQRHLVAILGTATLLLAVWYMNITAFGLLGALALIRFRNVLKDTRDTVFVFIALVVGMAVGSQRYFTAIIGAAALGLAVFYLNITSFGTLGRYDGYLTVRVSRAGHGRKESGALLDRFCRAIKPISTRQSGEEESAEFVYQIGLRDRERSSELISALRGLDHVTHVSLVLRSELSEV